MEIMLQDVYVIAGPVVDRPYDPEKEKRLIRAAKKKKLEDLEGESLLSTGLFIRHEFESKI